MPLFLRSTLILCLFSFGLLAQEKFTLSGTIVDAQNNETLIGVTILVKETQSYAITNEYGFYSITLPSGNYSIAYSYLGYTTKTEKIELNQNRKLDILLEGKGEILEEVIITTDATKSNIRKPEISVHKLTTATIKQMPVVLGEVDILKSILFLPGVTNAGEGQSGFNVRGGGADQNLLLLDEATIYNSSHLFGFFSVFNPDAIKDLKLYKGGIPARFGGRASSVLELYQKEGNSKNFHMNGGIGLISSRILAEGPLQKNKGSFLIGGRGSYAHLFLKLSNNENSAYFYDLNTKLNYKFNKNNTVFLSGYFGRDVFNINQSFENIYGNATLNLRWNHLYSDQLFSNLSLIYSDYYYGLNLDFVGFNWDSGIKNYNIKYDFRHYLTDKIKLFYGVSGIYYDFNPGTIEPSRLDSGINYRQLEKKYAFEPAIYWSAEQKISNRLNVEYGFRYSWFYRLGSSTKNLYANNNPVLFDDELKIYEKATPIGTKYYGANQVMAAYDNFEPRFALSYELNNQNSLKLGYNRMVQYLQLISNTASPTPLDVWTPSDSYIQPQIADQIALGYFSNLQDDKFSLEVETFYKRVKNRMDYIDGADLIANEAIEQVILNGEMRAYGLEVLFRKKTGNWTGWVAYTLSKSEQRTPGRTPNETGINNDEWYRSGYDKRHNLSLTSTYKWNKKWTFGANFVLQSGQPITYPNSQYVYQGITVPNYGLRNENNLPLYHHLDISATLTPKQKSKKWTEEWVFSIYNLYARKNAANISFRQNLETGRNEAIRLSIFGIVPAITYNFKF